MQTSNPTTRQSPESLPTPSRDISNPIAGNHACPIRRIHAFDVNELTNSQNRLSGAAILAG
jgi:hypothetical protein